MRQSRPRFIVRVIDPKESRYRLITTETYAYAVAIGMGLLILGVFLIWPLIEYAINGPMLY